MVIVVIPYIEDNRESCPRCGSKEYWSTKAGYCANCRYIKSKETDDTLKNPEKENPTKQK